MKNYDMAEVQKQWYDRNGWPLDLNAVYAINEFKGDSSDMAEVQKWYLDGGPGSGNWGHKGRPGIRGGSGPGGGVAYRLNTPSGGYTGLVGAYKENEARNKENGGGKAEPKKSEEPKKKSKFEEALESGKCTPEDVDHAEVGDAVRISAFEYIKYSDNRWIRLRPPGTFEQEDIKNKILQANDFGREIKPSDGSVTKINDELNNATNGMTDVDDIKAEVKRRTEGAPAGTMYVDDDGYAYVKLEDGDWLYSGPKAVDGDDGVNFNIANDCARRVGVEEESTLRYNAERSKIRYNEAKKLDHIPSDEEIIERLGGADQTAGSCASLAYAYAGQKAGIDVVDYRGGKSQEFFSLQRNTMKTMEGIGAKSESARSDFTSAKKLLKEMPEGKEHILMTGRHAAVVKKENGEFFFLEMQGTARINGWHKLDSGILAGRFGCKRSHTIRGIGPVELSSVLIDVEKLGKNKEFQKTLGYINTAVDKQKKGAGGYAK